MADGSDRVLHVAFTDVTLVLHLADGCILTVPLAWYPPLIDAPPDARACWNLAGARGDGVRWPDLDVTLDVPGLLKRGRARPDIFALQDEGRMR